MNSMSMTVSTPSKSRVSEVMLRPGASVNEARDMRGSRRDGDGVDREELIVKRNVRLGQGVRKHLGCDRCSILR